MSSPIINIITYGLPGKLASQIYNEYTDRLKDVKYLVNSPSRYSDLKNDMDTVEMLLALSIFHKRVICCLDGANKFYGTVTRDNRADSILMGEYEFTLKERNKVLGILVNYRQLIDKFGIPEKVMDYDLTKEFLRKLIDLKYAPKKSNPQKGSAKEDTETGKYDDLPF